MHEHHKISFLLLLLSSSDSLKHLTLYEYSMLFSVSYLIIREPIEHVLMTKASQPYALSPNPDPNPNSNTTIPNPFKTCLPIKEPMLKNKIFISD